MRIRTFLTIAGLLALAFGLGFLVAPGPMLARYGVGPDPAAVLMSRFFGSALFHVGLLVFLARGLEDLAAQHAIVRAGRTGAAAGLFVALSGQLSGVVNALGWSTVAICLALLLGYGYFHFGKARGTAAAGWRAGA